MHRRFERVHDRASVEPLVVGAKSTIAGSGIGGVRATQEVMDLCAAHGIKPDVEVVPVTQINRVYEALDKNNDSGIRYVLDIAGTLKASGDRPKDAMGAPPKLSPPPNKIGIFKILGEVCKLLCGFHWK